MDETRKKNLHANTTPRNFKLLLSQTLQFELYAKGKNQVLRRIFECKKNKVKEEWKHCIKITSQFVFYLVVY
jgi:hypothetical protein